jgi:hypothetical protein
VGLVTGHTVLVGANVAAVPLVLLVVYRLVRGRMRL